MYPAAGRSGEYQLENRYSDRSSKIDDSKSDERKNEKHLDRTDRRRFGARRRHCGKAENTARGKNRENKCESANSIYAVIGKGVYKSSRRNHILLRVISWHSLPPGDTALYRTKARGHC